MNNFFQRILKSKKIVYGVFIASVSLTLSAYYFSLWIAKEEYLTNFQNTHSTLVINIEKKLHVYEQVMWAGVALFNSSDKVSRQEWASFSKILDINTHWPGIQALGFAQLVPADEKAIHEKLVQSEGFLGYSIYPNYDRDMYTSIIYIEPFDWRNQRAFGFDMWTNEERREAMKASMLNGDAHATSPITLLQETQSDIQKGFLIYTPVFKSADKLDKGMPRSLADLNGWVYAPFRVDDLILPLTKTLPSLAGLSIEDIASASDEPDHPSNIQPLFYLPTEALNNTISLSKDILVFGRIWRITLTEPNFNLLTQSHNGNLIFALLSSFVDIILLMVLLSYRRSQLKQDEIFKSKYKVLIASLNEKTDTIEKQNYQVTTLEKNVETLQNWLEQREIRISELKMNQKEVD